MSNPPPTLLTELSIAPLLGAVALLGATPGYDIASVSPAPASISAASLVPTVITQSGPTAAPDPAAWVIEGQVPSLFTERVISPTLPDAIPAENDLTPTLVWQETCLPAQAPLGLAGLVPAVILDSGQTIYPLLGAASFVTDLAPLLGLPAAEETLKTPDRASLETQGLEPLLIMELTVSPTIGSLTFTGPVPTTVVAYGWVTVALSGDAVWTDVPRV